MPILWAVVNFTFGLIHRLVYGASTITFKKETINQIMPLIYA